MNKQAIRILSLALVLAASSSVAFAQKVWKGSWATAVEWTGKGDMPKESLSNRSCRQVVHVSFGGEELRVKLSNEQSKEPVEIKSVYIADTDVPSNWGIQTKTVKYLKFRGKKNVTIAPGKAIFSGYIAASVFGVTSAKISTTSVKAPVAMAIPASPQIRTAMTVAMADARMLTKLLPIRIKPIRRSGRSKSLAALRAPKWLFFAKCFKR